MNYSKSALKGISWYSLLRLIVRSLILVKVAILAHVLLPSQFGEFGAAAIALGLFEIFTETGINPFLLQEKTDPATYINTAWIISIVRGLLISALIFLASPFIAVFFHNPSLRNLLYMICLVPVIRGFINPLIIKFQKNLEYKNESFYRLTIITVELVVTVVLAVLTHSVYSFVWGLIASALVEVLLSHTIIKIRPVFQFDSNQAKTILHRGKWVTGFGVLDYVYTQGDNTVVGRLMDQSSLGIYQNAYKISAFPLTEIGEVFYKVTFPIFVQFSDNLPRLRSAAVKSAVLLTGTLFVASVSLFFLAQPLVQIVLGPNWSATVPVVKALAFLGFFRGCIYCFNPVFMAIKKQQIVTYITAVSTIGLLVTIVPFVSRWGLLGAAYSAMIGSIVAIPVALFFIIRLFKTL